MYLAQDGDQWRTLVNTVINLRDKYGLNKVMNLRVPLRGTNLIGWEFISLSRGPPLHGINR